MPTVKSDLVDGHDLSNVLKGTEITRTFHVSALVTAPENQLIEAVTTSGVPLLNEAYPGQPQILCVEQKASPDGPNAARVVCLYSVQTNVSSFNQPQPAGNDGQDVKQIAAATREITTTVDRDGQPMVLVPPPAYVGWPDYTSEARVLVPVATIVFERVEQSVAASRARSLVGKINATVAGAYAANTLLFSALDASTNDGGRLWNCTYTFRYDSGGWKHEDAFHSPDGRVPDGASPVLFDVLGEGNFSTLNLDFSDSQTPIL